MNHELEREKKPRSPKEVLALALLFTSIHLGKASSWCFTKALQLGSPPPPVPQDPKA